MKEFFFLGRPSVRVRRVQVVHYEAGLAATPATPGQRQVGEEKAT